jgi:K+-transporting ATPase A subunit
VRFGIANSSLFTTITTDASCGAVNNMHDSLLPLAGMVPMVNIMLGEIIFGGVGTGLYGMLLFAIVAVFVAGLMVGRTPEYLGKKIEAKEVKMAILAILILPLSILGFTLSQWSSPLASPGWPIPARMASAKHFMPTRRRPATMAALLRVSAPIRLSTIRR